MMILTTQEFCIPKVNDRLGALEYLAAICCSALNRSSCSKACELYIPQERATDRERRRAVGIPVTVEFAAKPELARRMVGPGAKT
jgi:SRSO17 transposase